MTSATIGVDEVRSARVSPVAAALSILLAAITIVLGAGWPTAIFAIAGLAVAVTAFPRTRRAEVIALAVAIGASTAIAGAGLAMVSLNQFAESLDCGPDLCPEVGPPLLVSGAVALMAAAVGTTRLVWLIRQRAQAHLLLPAVRALLLGLLALAMILGERWGGALVAIAGVTAATGALRFAARPRHLQAAVLAQAADLGTFGFVWQAGYGELNPLGRWTMEALLALGPSSAS